MNFNIYGLIIGLSIVIAYLLVENKLKNIEGFDKLFFLTIFSGLIGARVWHVFTDWHLYKNNLTKIFFIKEGGLSIIGAFIGAFTFLFVFTFVLKKITVTNFKIILDASIFGLPIAQSFGRFANYFNQELYGLPSNLSFPFSIYISPENRLEKYQNIVYYHPLFLYESFFTLIFYLFLIYSSHKLKYKLGSLITFFSYVLYYSTIRFFLDFLRADHQKNIFGIIGTNQLLLLVLICISLTILIKKKYVKYKQTFFGFFS